MNTHCTRPASNHLKTILSQSQNVLFYFMFLPACALWHKCKVLCFLILSHISSLATPTEYGSTCLSYLERLYLYIKYVTCRWGYDEAIRQGLRNALYKKEFTPLNSVKCATMAIDFSWQVQFLLILNARMTRSVWQCLNAWKVKDYVWAILKCFKFGIFFIEGLF